MPDLTRYEVGWWNRTIHRDGSYLGLEKAEALEAATEYAQRVSIGSLQSLRKFIETSFLKTPNPKQYVAAFRKMLVGKGHSEFEERLKRFGGLSYLAGRDWSEERLRKAVAAICCGLTQKRGLLIPEWADDTALWTSKLELVY